MKLPRRLKSHFLITISLLFLFFMIGGCSGTTPETGNANQTKTAAETVINPPSTFAELLGLVPADSFSGQRRDILILSDHASLYRDYGVSFSDFSNIEELMNLPDSDIFINFYAGSDITGYGNYADRTTIKKEYVGYDISSIDAEIQFGIPPLNAVAAIGRFDPEITNNALSNQADWPDWAINAYTTENYSGVTIHSWGNGLRINLETRLVPPHIDALGRARPLAVTNRYLFYCGSLEAVKEMIDASQNTMQSLADLPEYAAIAKGLTDLKAYVALVGEASSLNNYMSVIDYDPKLTQEQINELKANIGPRLKKFLAFGSGQGKDDKGYYTAIVLYHENPADALANVSLLKERLESSKSFVFDVTWSEIITETDIQADGNVLIARLYSRMGIWTNWVYAQDNLLLHEE
jgi:hypothetical protein